MQMYKAIQMVDFIDEMSSIKHIMYEDTVKIYRKMKKTCKTHCNIADLNKKNIAELNQLGCGTGRVADVKREMVSCLLKKMELM